MAPIRQSAAARARAMGYRSGLETRTAKHLDALGVPYAYEPGKVPFTEPAKARTYTPDFVLFHNGIVIDTKGRWETADRQKFKLLREQHPDLDLRLVFSNPLARIGKKSPTTYAMYATKIGCKFAKETIPQSWIDEPVNEASLAICRKLFT